MKGTIAFDHLFFQFNIISLCPTVKKQNYISIKIIQIAQIFCQNCDLTSKLSKRFDEMQFFIN